MTSAMHEGDDLKALSSDEGIALLTAWSNEKVEVGVVYAARHSEATCAVKGRLHLTSVVLQVHGDSAVFHVGIIGAEFQHGPAVLFDRFFRDRRSKPGLHITTGSGDWLFVAPASGSSGPALELKP